MIRVERFYAHNPLRNFSYLIFDEATGNAWVLDPFDAGPISEYIKKQGLSLKGILNTHQHFDHVRGNDELRERFGAEVRHLGPGTSLNLDRDNQLEVIASPGHTRDHQVFVWKNPTGAPVLFSGDTLFNAGVGNCKNGGNVEDLYETVGALVHRLPLDTILQPGHDYLKRNLEFALSVDPGNLAVQERLREVSDDPLLRRPLTLGEERETNPFLRLEDAAVKERLHSQGKELFIKLRSLRDQW